MAVTEHHRLTNELALDTDDARADLDSNTAVTQIAPPACVVTAALRHRFER